jgi:hypothetical protein
MRAVIAFALLVACAQPKPDVVYVVEDDHEDIFPAVLAAAKEKYEVGAVDEAHRSFATQPIVLDEAPSALVLLVKVQNRGVGYGGRVVGKTKGAMSMSTKHRLVVTPVVYRNKEQLAPDDIPPAARERARAFAEHLFGRVTSN